MSRPWMVLEVGSPGAGDFHLPLFPPLPLPELEPPSFLPSVLGLNLATDNHALFSGITRQNHTF